MTEIKKIMGLLLLLVALFSIGLWVMSARNIEHSRHIISDLRLKQIEESFYANLQRISAHHTLIERNTRERAALGELFYRLHRADGRTYQAELEKALFRQLHNFPEAGGGGIWFEPYTYAADQQYFAVYGYWLKTRLNVTWNYADGSRDYHHETWYQNALPADWPRDQTRPAEFYWTPARYETALEAAVITLTSPMYAEDGVTLIGVATTDWSFDDIAKLIQEVNVTPNSFAFLLDEKDRKFVNPPPEKNAGIQPLITALSYHSFQRDLQTDSPATMHTRHITVADADHALFFAHSHGGMLFGICVPVAELNAVVTRMHTVNYQLVAIVLLFLLPVAGIILYRVRATMKLLHSLYTDRLTGLATRSKLLSHLAKQEPDALILLNIDAFKELNDFYGHQCGDHVLEALAGDLRYDFIPQTPLGEQRPSVKLYKMPGDEFAFAVTAVAVNAGLEGYLQKLSSYVAERRFKYADQDITFTVTLGAALSDAVEALEGQANPLLSCANMALKKAKQQKQHYLIYDPGLEILKDYQHNLVWAAKLKHSIEDNRIVPYFQPILDLHSGKVKKYECLMRIIDTDGRVVLPGEFLDVAQKLKIYPQTTRIMVDTCFHLLTDLDSSFSINLSYLDIADTCTACFILDNLCEYGVADQVTFEILESESILNYERVHAFIQEAKALGCTIAIDDFGTGYSNFEHLLRLNADIVKIDGSLIKNLDNDRNAEVITQGIVNFAKQLGMRTVAEFVHSAAVLEKVRALGVDCVQGFYFGFPQPSPEHEEPERILRK